MNKIIFLLTGLFLFNQGIILAQNEGKQALTLAVGAGHIMRQNLSFSPMIHTSWSPLNACVQYTKSKKMEQQLYIKFGQYRAIVGESFSFNSFFNEEESETGPHIFTLLDINYSLGKKIALREDFSLALGGRLRNRLQPASYLFGNAGSFGYNFSLGLDLWLNFQYALNEKNHFMANLAIPVFSYNSRSPYLSQDDEYFFDSYSHNGFTNFIQLLKDGEIESWGKSQSMDFDISYFYTVSAKWDIGVAYWLSMNFSQAPTSFSSIENIFYLTGRFKL